LRFPEKKLGFPLLGELREGQMLNLHPVAFVFGFGPFLVACHEKPLTASVSISRPS
jgi:hypothetical protein